jgi:Aldo/keto reductases, related to diketogulonate reductase
MTTPTIQLNDGSKIPAIGFGTFQIPDDGTTYQAVKDALAAGLPAHRHGRGLFQRRRGRSRRP